MAQQKELVNEYSLSWSTIRLIKWCLRAWYLKQWGSWQGWDRKLSKDDPRRLAYTLKKGTSLNGLVGKFVHEVAANALFGCSRGLEYPGTQRRQGYGQEALRQLHQTIDASRHGLYWQNPKKHPVIHEAFYNDLELLDKVKAAEEKLVKCLEALWRNGHMQNIGRKLLAREYELEAVEDLSFVALHVPTQANQSNDDWAETEIKVWVVPDLVVKTQNGRRFIPDWKTGSPKETDIGQLGFYAWWLDGWGVEPEHMALALVYLGHYEETVKIASKDDVTSAIRLVQKTVEETRRFLVDGDIERNEPREIEVFEQLPADDKRCQWCQYKRLCNRG